MWIFERHLESDDTNTSVLSDDAANVSSRVGGVAVGRLEGTLLGDLGGAVGVDVAGLDGEALLIRIEVGDDGVGGVGEGVLLNEDLGTHARVDTGDTAVVARAVDVAGTEADGG